MEISRFLRPLVCLFRDPFGLLNQVFLQPFLRLVLVSAIALIPSLYLNHSPAFAVTLSPVKGLMALKTLAQQAVPYGEAMANDKPTFLEFYADWCGTCQSMAPVVAGLHERYGDRINFVMVNIDQAQAAEAVRQYGVTGIPQIVTLDSQATVTEQFVGRVPASRLDQALVPLIISKIDHI